MTMQPCSSVLSSVHGAGRLWSTDGDASFASVVQQTDDTLSHGGWQAVSMLK